MFNLDFYRIIDSEIELLTLKFKQNDFLKKRDPNGKKSFGFLLWFLKTYLPNQDLANLEKYITEGTDDASCDLIFDNLDNFGNKVFYVVQAKWFVDKNIQGNNEITKEIKSCLTDFRLVLKGLKESKQNNQNFKIRYEEFLKHKLGNGKIKFIFVALCLGPKNIDAYKEDFETRLVNFELFDINNLKKHYLELEYKGISTHNPIEEPYEPKGDIELEVEASNYLVSKQPLPYESYIFLVKPRLIFDLFDKYSFALFYKNIRNPLHKSIYNPRIEDTLKNNPLNFWYFNNGVNVITDEIYPFHLDSKKVTIRGLQIINGAQTVYSIYSAYNEASEEEKRKMDQNVFVTLKIFKSAGRNFDLDVTRFTNSQNPIIERDFHSNDNIQKRLQEDFLFNTNIWYEKRRGEFRKKIRSVNIIPNENLAQTYLAYYLEKPLLAKSKKSMIFVSKENNSSGLYEDIFSDNMRYDDMQVSYYFYGYIEKKRRDSKRIIHNRLYKPSKKKSLRHHILQYASFDILALLKPLLYCVNEDNVKGINGKLIYDHEKNGSKKISLYYEYIVDMITKYLYSKLQKDKNNDLVLSVYFKRKDTYKELKDSLKVSAKDKTKLKL